MKIATRCLGKTKSGLPERLACLRQPETAALRSSLRKTFSVVALPFERMLAIFRERCSRESQSAILLQVLGSWSDFRVLCFEPIEEMKLVLNSGAAHLLKQFDAIGFGGAIFRKPSLQFVRRRSAVVATRIARRILRKTPSLLIQIVNPLPVSSQAEMYPTPLMSRRQVRQPQGRETLKGLCFSLFQVKAFGSAV